MANYASFVLTPAESKRLIAKAVAALPQVTQAKATGRLIIANGTTNGYVAEEITGSALDISNYTAGVITDGRYCLTPPQDRLKPVCYENGALSERPWLDILNDFTQDDVLIKGANAIDLQNNAGILVADAHGGTIGRAIGPLTARGSHLIIPVGLEKLIPCVKRASSVMGIAKHQASLGCGSGMLVTNQGTIITEVTALKILFNLDATPISAGGIGGSEGAIGLAITGNESQITQCLTTIRKIKGERNLKANRRQCAIDCGSHCHWLKK